MSRILAPRAYRRAAAVLVTGLAVYGVTAVLQLEPDLVAVLLVTALLAAGFTLLLEGVDAFAPQWYPPAGADPLTRGRDGATFADLRLLESHQTARHPDDHLRRRLALLADRSLRASHGVALGSDEARAHLGPAVAALLDEAPSRGRRLSPRDIDLCLRTIEEL